MIRKNLIDLNGLLKQKNRPLFVFDFLKNQVFNQADVDREQCQNLL